MLRQNRPTWVPLIDDLKLISINRRLVDIQVSFFFKAILCSITIDTVILKYEQICNILLLLFNQKVGY